MSYFFLCIFFVYFCLFLGFRVPAPVLPGGEAAAAGGAFVYIHGVCLVGGWGCVVDGA